jgi:outer membrane protein OmpA-like peptidoglycan-associated protein
MGNGERVLRAVAVCALVAGSSPARAEGLDAERFQPAVGTEAAFSVEHPQVPFHLGWGLGAFFDVADDPVVERDDMDDEILSRPLDTAASLDLIGSLGFFGWSELGVHLPLQVVYSGDDYAEGGVMLAPGGGLGDLRLVPKVLFLRSGSLERHFLVGAALPVSLPTGDGEALRGADGVTVEPRLLAALHIGEIGVGANLGYRIRSEHPAGLPWANEIAFAFNASIGIVPDRLWFQAELFGGKQVGSDVEGADLPMEALGGLVYRLTGSLDLHGGAGLGFTDGIGDPDFRIVAGIRFKHHTPERHGFRDGDEDGILDKDDDCPTEVEDLDAFEDEDGCPEEDNDQDGIPDEKDECPDLPEEEGGDGDGCPSKTYVKIVGGEMQIFGKVQFKTGASEFDPKSDSLLDQIAAAMRANPQVKRVRVEGHTDDIGGEALNQRLSEERAASVRKALISRDVDGDRLESKGFGESRPAAPNLSAAGRAKNRRVEFIIVESDR